MRFVLHTIPLVLLQNLFFMACAAPICSTDSVKDTVDVFVAEVPGCLPPENGVVPAEGHRWSSQGCECRMERFFDENPRETPSTVCYGTWKIVPETQVSFSEPPDFEDDAKSDPYDTMLGMGTK